MGDLDITWKSMLTRSYKPFFASLFGIYASKVYNRFMVVYKDDWCYWYLPKEYYNRSHDMHFCERFDSMEYKNYAYNAVEMYEIVYKHIEEVLAHHRKTKNNRTLTKQTLLKILGDPYNTKVDKNIAPKDIEKLDTFFDNFGILVAYPEMTLGPYIKKTMMDKLSEIIYDGKKYDDLEEAQHLAIDRMSPILTLDDHESESVSANYEFDLRSLALKTKNELIRDAIIEITDTIIEPTSGSRKDYFLRIEKGIKRRLQRIPRTVDQNFDDYYLSLSEDIKGLIERYSPIRSGWQFGRGLSSEEVKHRLRDLIRFDDVSIDQLLKLEIDYATLKKYFESMAISKKALLERIKKKSTAKSMSELLLYINIISYDGWVRYNRKNYASKINYISEDIMKNVAFFLKFKSWEDIGFITISEIAEKLKNKEVSFDEKEIERRKKNMLMIFENGTIRGKELKSGDDVKEYMVKLKIEGENPYDDKGWEKEFPVEGEVVGLWEREIIGNVVRVDNEQDLIDVTDKDIIVAKMIEPYHGMVFRQPMGMIIEDPGIASHAVYVAHSRGIPLIVGVEGILSLVRKYKLVGEGKRPDIGLKMQPDGVVEVANLWEGDKK